MLISGIRNNWHQNLGEVKKFRVYNVTTSETVGKKPRGGWRTPFPSLSG